MTERISDQNVRKEKVVKLKTKLNAEIEDRITKILAKFHGIKFTAGDEEVRVLSTRLHNLFVIKDFVNFEESFNLVVANCPEKDRVVYQLDIDTIDWMLEEEFLLNRILGAIEYSGECAEILLCDTFFKHDVCSVLDKVVWRNKKEASNE